MSKKLTHSLLSFILITTYSFFNFQINYAQDSGSESDCIPPTVTVLNIDEENNTMTIEVEGAEGEVFIYAEDENGEPIEGFPVPLSNGTFEITYIEGATYTIQMICSNGKIIIVPLQLILEEEVFYVADIMGLSNLCIDAPPQWHVSFLSTGVRPASLQTYNVNCICYCMNNLLDPNLNIPFLEYSCRTCRTTIRHNQSTTTASTIYSSSPSSNTILSQAFKTKSHEILLKTKLFPIPFNNTLNLEVNLNEEAVVSIKAYNTIGQLHLFQEDFFYQGQHRLILDTSNLESGLYFFEIETNGKKKSIKATKL